MESSILLQSVFSALVELAVHKPIEHYWSKAQRNDRVLRVLEKVGLRPDDIPSDFEGVYAHALVEWGVFRSADEIAFFRHEIVQQAFRNTFHQLEKADFKEETEGIVEMLRGEGKHFSGDPRAHLDEFTVVFHKLARASRTTSEVLRDREIAEARREIGELQLQLQQLRAEQKFDEIIALLKGFMVPQPQDDRQALRPYLEWVQRRGRRLAISTLDPAGKDSDQVTLEDVFINLDVERVMPRLDNQWEIGTVTAAIGHIHWRRQIVIRGDPGSGKSTLLHYLAYCLAGDWLDAEAGFLTKLAWEVEYIPQQAEYPEQEGGERLYAQRTGAGEERETRIEYWQQPYIPVLIELRNFVRRPFTPTYPLAFWHYFKNYLEEEIFDAEMGPELQATQEALYRRAVRGEVIWLLDGIDEVPLEQRPAVWQAVAALEAGVLGGGRWVATSRILSFDEALLPKRGIEVQTLRALSQPQINQFVNNWFQALRRAGELTLSEAETKAQRLQYAVEHRDEDFFKMAANPMLLTIMALVQTYHGTLPEQRARLYKACVDTLLLRWQRRKEGQSEAALPTVLTELGVDYGQLERLLWEVGWKAHEGAGSRQEAADIRKGEVLTIAEEHLGSLSKAAKFIEYTEQRAHLLVGRGGQGEDFYTFPHRTLQEFLAACHLATQRHLGRKMRALAAKRDMWREVLNLAVGTLVFNGNQIAQALDAINELAPQEVPSDEDETGWYQVWLAGELCAIVGPEATQKDKEVGVQLLPRLRRQLAALLERGVLKVAERHEAANALAQLGDPRPGVGINAQTGLPDIVWGGEVPAGQYTIGDKKPLYDDEALRPAPITTPYRLSRYPVTYAQFQCFVEAPDFHDGRWWAGMPPTVKDWNDRNYPVQEIGTPAFPVANRPRDSVSWYQAVAFCRWLDFHFREAGLIDADEQLDLPHEFEWEVAARYAGNGRCDDRTYPWGHDPITADRANYSDTGLGETSAVGLFPAGRQPLLDLYDLSGNVWEWCCNKVEEPQDDQVDGTGALRVVRGGSWGNLQGFARAAYRYRFHPVLRVSLGGFRVVRRAAPSL